MIISYCNEFACEVATFVLPTCATLSTLLCHPWTGESSIYSLKLHFHEDLPLYQRTNELRNNKKTSSLNFLIRFELHNYLSHTCEHGRIKFGGNMALLETITFLTSKRITYISKPYICDFSMVNWSSYLINMETENHTYIWFWSHYINLYSIWYDNYTADINGHR